jgi:hypothetical protein
VWNAKAGDEEHAAPEAGGAGVGVAAAVTSAVKVGPPVKPMLTLSTKPVKAPTPLP